MPDQVFEGAGVGVVECWERVVALAVEMQRERLASSVVMLSTQSSQTRKLALQHALVVLQGCRKFVKVTGTVWLYAHAL